MMPYLTIVRSWSYGTFPKPDPRGQQYWADRLATVHQQKMSQGREHAEAIVDVSREYTRERGSTGLV